MFDDIFDINKLNKRGPKKGDVLISEPLMDDPYFKRSVILLCEHNEETTIGFVLNNYIKIKAEDLIEDFNGLMGKISIGGPVDTNNLFYIHTLGHQLSGSTHVYDNIYLGGNFEELKELVKIDPSAINQVRFFLGYSGWTPNQLDEELENNSWMISVVKGSTIMNTDINNLWKKLLENKSPKHKILSEFPTDPTLN